MTPTADARLKVIYDGYEQRYLRSLPPEHFVESIPQATQRKITVASFELVRVARPDVQCFNEMLVQYPGRGVDVDQPGQVVPDNMVVVHPEPIVAEGSFNLPLQPARPLLVLEYVSKSNRRKDYDLNLEKYERYLKVPYYLLFEPNLGELILFRMADGKYVTPKPDAAGRYAIPELELEVGLLAGWVRYWFRGRLLPLPGDLLIERDAAREQRDQFKQERDAARGQLDAERQARAAAEAELARLREELARAKGT